MSIQHKDIPEAGLHEPKGVSTAVSGTVYQADGSGSGSWQNISLGAGDIKIERLLDAESTSSSQNPNGLGEANAIQVEFGNAVGTPGDAINLEGDGTLKVNESGLYRIKVAMQLGRAGGAGTSILFFRVLVNGTQAGRSVSFKLDSAEEDRYFENDNWVNVTSGTSITFEVMRDDAGNDSGGLVLLSPTGSWMDSPTAALRVERWVD